MTKPLCIYHDGCDDGFGAAFAVWRAHEIGEVEFYAARHGESPPDVTDRDVIMVDFSYRRAVLETMINQCKSMLILDHHKTAEADLKDIEIGHPNVKTIFDMSRSGAMITWQHFHPGKPIPHLIDYIQDRDLWTNVLPDTEKVSIALRSYPRDFEVWDMLFPNLLAIEGESILRYHRMNIENTKKNAWRANIGGYIVPVVNASPSVASEVAGELSVGHPFAATFWINEKKVEYSLRSRKDGVDVSKIAESFGGGGHYQAAGFQSPVIVHTAV